MARPLCSNFKCSLRVNCSVISTVAVRDVIIIIILFLRYCWWIGTVQIRNWKPVSCDVITDNLSATIDDVLGTQLSSFATLSIRLRRYIISHHHHHYHHHRHHYRRRYFQFSCRHSMKSPPGLQLVHRAVLKSCFKSPEPQCAEA